MPAITIRNLDDTLKARLRLQAARHGHSMEEDARQLLHKGLEPDPAIGPVRLTALAQSLFSAEHGVDLVLPPRDAARRACLDRLPRPRSRPPGPWAIP